MGGRRGARRLRDRQVGPCCATASPAVADGPFAEAKEQIVGYCIVDCASMDRAVEIATRWPDARLCGMEVRPILSPDGAEM